MALPLSVSMLRRKRDDIRDAIVSYEIKLKQAQADLAHVLAALRLAGVPKTSLPTWTSTGCSEGARLRLYALRR